MIRQEYGARPRFIGALPPPVVFAISATDSSGGAGLQADLRAAVLLGAHMFSAVTSVTGRRVIMRV